MKQVIQNWDSALWHTDILWNNITWMISSNHKAFVAGVSVSRNADIVYFPTHPHAIVEWSPVDYRDHSVWVIGTGKLQVGFNCALDWDSVPVSDEAGWNANMVASQFKLYSN
jgi:hypothetical protein